MIKPSNNPITQGYSSSHKGIDFAGLNKPDEVKPVLDGEIIERVDEYTTNWSNAGRLTTKDYGNYIKVKHTDGTFGLFAHLRKGSSFVVGTKVKQGQTIARIGNTGNSSGPHLHFELRNASNTNIKPEFVEEQGTFVNEKTFINLVAKSSAYDQVVQYLELGDPNSTPADKVTASIAGIKSSVTACQNNLTNIEKDIRVSRATIQNKNEELARKTEERQEQEKLLNSQIESLYKELRVAREPLVQYEGRIKVMQGKIDELAKEKGNLLKQIAEWETAENLIIRIIKYLIQKVRR